MLGFQRFLATFKRNDSHVVTVAERGNNLLLGVVVELNDDARVTKTRSAVAKEDDFASFDVTEHERSVKGELGRQETPTNIHDNLVVRREPPCSTPSSWIEFEADCSMPQSRHTRQIGSLGATNVDE